jgi:hypothetical protein
LLRLEVEEEEGAKEEEEEAAEEAAGCRREDLRCRGAFYRWTQLQGGAGLNTQRKIVTTLWTGL